MAASLDEDIRAYDYMLQELEADHMGRRVVFYDRKLIATYDQFQDAAREAGDHISSGRLERRRSFCPRRSSMTLLVRLRWQNSGQIRPSAKAVQQMKVPTPGNWVEERGFGQQISSGSDPQRRDHERRSALDRIAQEKPSSLACMIAQRYPGAARTNEDR